MTAAAPLNLTVQQDTDGTWQASLPDGRVWPCVIGRGGVVAAADKAEGDGATPLGRWLVRSVRYRPDRVMAPATALPVQPMTREDGWCDAPDHPDYNKPVTLPFGASHEVMWRDDRLYDIVVILGHNDDPPVPGAGSAIFLHVAPEDFGTTAGCIALKRPDLEAALASLSPGSRICIEPPPLRAVPESESM